MKKLINYLPVMALVLGGSLALATIQPKVVGETYPKIGGQWQSTPVETDDEGEPGGWRCDGDEDICTGVFNSPPAPDAADPVGAREGVFTPL